MSHLLIQAMRQFVFQNNTAINALKMITVGFATSLTAVALVGCSPRDTAVLKKTIRAQAQKAGGNVVQANAGNVIDQPEQKSSECKSMNWGDIEIPNELDQKLSQRSMRAYIVAGNYACYKIGSEVQIKRIKDDISKSRGVLKVTKIEFINKAALNDTYAALMGLTLAELEESLNKQNPRNKSIVTITYFEVKSLNITPVKPPVRNINYELVKNDGEILSECKEESTDTLVSVTASQYDHVKGMLTSAVLLKTRSCLKVGTQVALKTAYEEAIHKKISYHESGRIEQIRRSTLELIFGMTIENRLEEFAMREQLAIEAEQILGEGGSEAQIHIMGVVRVLE